MVDTIGFANAVGGAPTYTGRQARQLNAVAFAGASAARPLGALTGVRPGTPTNTVTATATTWACGEFAGLADMMIAGESGPYPFAFDAPTGGSLTPADQNNPRIDIVYTLVVDPEDGTTVPNATRLYLAGTAASSPSAPAAPTGAFTIAQITVPKVGTGSPSVTWVAPYCAGAGGVVNFVTVAAMTAATVADGQLGYVLATGQLFQYVATAPTPGWYPVAGRPTLTAPSLTGIYIPGASAPNFSQQGPRVHGEGIVASTSATFVAGTTYTLGTIPPALAPASTQTWACSANVTALASVSIDSAGNIKMAVNTGFTGALALSLANCSWRAKGL